MGPLYLYVFVLFSGALQAVQAPVNFQLNAGMKNPWLAGCIVFGSTLLASSLLLLFFHRPLPSLKDIESFPWYLPMGGLLGGASIYAMFTFTDRIGAGAFNGLLVTGSILTSLLLDHFGVLGLERQPLTLARALGGGLIVLGITLVAWR